MDQPKSRLAPALIVFSAITLPAAYAAAYVLCTSNWGHARLVARAWQVPFLTPAARIESAIRGKQIELCCLPFPQGPSIFLSPSNVTP